MFYSGGARKKQALREILKFNPEKKDEVEEDERKSSIGNDSEDSHDSDSHDSEDSENTAKSKTRNTTDDDDKYPDDNNDYLVTLGSNDTSGKHYRYTFIDDELDYDIEEFADLHPDIKSYQLVIYKINTHSSSPFLEFLLYHDNDAGSSTSCMFPYYNHKSKQNVRKETDGIMKKLFTGKYRFKGFFHDIPTDKCFVFYEKYYTYETKTEITAFI